MSKIRSWKLIKFPLPIHRIDYWVSVLPLQDSLQQWFGCSGVWLCCCERSFSPLWLMVDIRRRWSSSVGLSMTQIPANFLHFSFLPMPEEGFAVKNALLYRTFVLSAPSKNQPAGNTKQVSPTPSLGRGCSDCFCVLQISVHWCQDSIWKGDCMDRRSPKWLWPFPWQKFGQILHQFRFLSLDTYQWKVWKCYRFRWIKCP